MARMTVQLEFLLPNIVSKFVNGKRSKTGKGQQGNREEKERKRTSTERKGELESKTRTGMEVNNLDYIRPIKKINVTRSPCPRAVRIKGRGKENSKEM